MADRLLVPFKPSYLRILETAVVLIATFALAYASQWLFPKIAVSYVMIVGLIVGYALIPRLGERWAIRAGAPMVTRSERSRRYLSELGPIGTPEAGVNLLASVHDARFRRGGLKTRPRRR